ncbi:hypothetical protein COL0002_03420 [Helicobacter pylori]
MDRYYSKTIILEGKAEQEVIEIMEKHIDEALVCDCFLKKINHFESVMVLIFEGRTIGEP